MQLSTDKVSPSALENINKWLREPKYAEYKDELQELINNEAWQQLEDAFFKVIEFGTGGRRGITGLGSNRINKVTIGESTQALCQYAVSFDPGATNKGIVIACDTRLSSPDLSRYVAQVAAANGFKTYIFDSFRATPELSFAVRELGCAIGVVVSASHNPPEDNGFKAYWNDGAQIVAPHDKGVLTVAENISTINVTGYDEAVAEGSIIVIGKEIDDAYVAAASNQAVGTSRNIKIAYSPLHGAGQTNTLPVLRAAGFIDISTVTAQMVPDGNFPTIENRKPNPEEKLANDLVVAQMMSEDADIAISNDPDADRIGVMVRQNDEIIYLSGNQSAVLATDFVLKKLQDKGTLTHKHYIAKTIVTTDMLDALAKHYDITVYGEMLIGFKYIGELIRNKESTDEVFVLGAEESFGLLKGSYARDKDGATGALPLAEYAAELKDQGKTLYDRLLELYVQHGLYIEQLDTMVCPGASGFDQMKRIMAGIREAVPLRVGDHEVTAVLDYSSLERKSITTGDSTKISCISGDVLVLEFGDKRRRITIRPSGTEPKLKFYVQWFKEADTTSDIADQYSELQAHLQGLSKELEGLLLEF